jgi:hypothetical protein
MQERQRKVFEEHLTSLTVTEEAKYRLKEGKNYMKSMLDWRYLQENPWLDFHRKYLRQKHEMQPDC